MQPAIEIDRIDVRSLRTLLLLLTERSVSRAAQKVDVSQPAMSHTLARLRTLFSDPLLIRGPGGMVCSERGAELAAGARDILDRFDRLVSQERTFDPSESRRVFVVTAAAYSEHVLISAVADRMRHEAPSTRLEVRPPPYGHAYGELEAGRADLHVAWAQGPAASSLRSVALFTDRVVCILSRRSRRQRQRPLTLREYLEAPHVRAQSAERTTTGSVVDAAVAKHRRSLNIAMHVQGFTALARAVEGTDLIATIPRRAAEDLVAGRELGIHAVPLRLPTVRVVGYWHERSQHDEGHRWFRDLLISVGRSLPA
jgi:DNA-binding transcriptional LysR family regulator